MGFNAALSGLNAASNMLSVTGNNIANANTAGFKRSRSEFADVYATSQGGVSSTTPGAGVRVANVAQQFGQGNLEFTDNVLDLAISGEGFFQLGSSVTNTNEREYTRAGAFHADESGYVVNHLEQPLLAYAPNGDTLADGFSTGVLTTLKIDTAQGLPRATTNVVEKFNLWPDAPVSAVPFPGSTPGAVDKDSYYKAVSIPVYDSLGNSHTATNYFVKTATANQWDVYSYIDGNPMGGAVASSRNTLQFNTDGSLSVPATGQFTFSGVAAGANAAPMSITFDVSGSTQQGDSEDVYSIETLSQDGLTIGRLTGVKIDDNGVVFARYSNGAAKPLGQVALARFQNPQGLSKLGDTQWGESASSGLPITGVAGSNSFGSIKSGAVEGSNVDLAAQLVNLIIAQQAYQANAQTISTENQVVQTLLNVR